MAVTQRDLQRYEHTLDENYRRIKDAARDRIDQLRERALRRQEVALITASMAGAYPYESPREIVERARALQEEIERQCRVAHTEDTIE